MFRKSIRYQFKQSRPILFSLPAKILQTHQLTQNSYWVHEKNLPTTFSWLAEKNYMDFLFRSMSQISDFLFSLNLI